MTSAPTTLDLQAERPPRSALGAASGSRLFGTVVAAPPWAYDRKMKGTLKAGTTMQNVPMDTLYPTMSVEEICALPVAELAGADSHLYLWTTQAWLRESYRVLDAWGYKQGAILVWSKPPKGVCGTYVCSTEFCIFGRRGNLQ